MWVDAVLYVGGTIQYSMVFLKIVSGVMSVYQVIRLIRMRNRVSASGARLNALCCADYLPTVMPGALVSNSPRPVSSSYIPGSFTIT